MIEVTDSCYIYCIHQFVMLVDYADNNLDIRLLGQLAESLGAP